MEGMSTAISVGYGRRTSGGERYNQQTQLKTCRTLRDYSRVIFRGLHREKDEVVGNALMKETSKGTMVKPQPSICSCQRCLLIHKWKVLV